VFRQVKFERCDSLDDGCVRWLRNGDRKTPSTTRSRGRPRALFGPDPRVSRRALVLSPWECQWKYRQGGPATPPGIRRRLRHEATACPRSFVSDRSYRFVLDNWNNPDRANSAPVRMAEYALALLSGYAEPEDDGPPPVGVPAASRRGRADGPPPCRGAATRDHARPRSRDRDGSPSWLRAHGETRGSRACRALAATAHTE